MIPFTIDHLGGLGPMAYSFLFDRKEAPFVCSAPLPSTARLCSNMRLDATHQRAIATPVHLLTRANQHWSAQSSRSIGSTYHAQSPTQWALQMLSVNFSRAFSTHIQHALWKCTNDPMFNDRPVPIVRLGQQSFTSPTGGPDSTSRFQMRSNLTSLHQPSARLT